MVLAYGGEVQAFPAELTKSFGPGEWFLLGFAAFILLIILLYWMSARRCDKIREQEGNASLSRGSGRIDPRKL